MTENSPLASESSPTSVYQTHISDSRPWLWKPGQSGNPNGQYDSPLRSLAAQIRAETGNGREIAALYLEVMRGNPVKMRGRVIKKGKNGRKISVLYVRPTLDQRLDAAAWLADRGWGKAKETIELTGEASPAQRLELLRRLSEEDRAQLRGLLQRALEAKPLDAIPPAVVAMPSDHNAPPLLQVSDSVRSESAVEPRVEPTV